MQWQKAARDFLRGAPDNFFEDEGENEVLSNGEDEVDGGTTFKREPFLDAEQLILSGEQRII